MWRQAGARLAFISSRRARLCRSPKERLFGAQESGNVSKTFSASTSWFSSSHPMMAEKSDKALTEDEQFGIATGLEREELEAEAKGIQRFDLEPPRGPFGTKEAPALVQSHFDERIVGCSGGYGDEEHDVIWFRLKKNETHECSVCGQVFKLDVVGKGGPPH